MNRTGPRTGLLGGSFNPAHGGHRKITLAVIEALRLDEAWWLVSPGNPLKPREGMAKLGPRLVSAQRLARRAAIRVSAIERELGSRYTADTLVRLSRRYPRRRFVWIMGMDNLAQFHRWHKWRTIARTMPIAVAVRPGYGRSAFAGPAMAWLRRYRVSAGSLRNRGEWSAPALVILRFDPDPRSATAIRKADPLWAESVPPAALRDGVTHRLIPWDAA